MNPTLQIRLFTNDQFVLDKVFYANAYKLATLPKDSVVFDIGAHIGFFATNCAVRGAATIYCFEPNGENFECLLRNTSFIRDGIVAIKSAVLFDHSFVAFEAPEITEDKFFDFASVNMAGDDSVAKEVSLCMSLDTALLNYGEKEVHLLKINLGGTYEPDVLVNSKLISKCNAVCGMTKTDDTASLDKLFAHMKENGFSNSSLVDTGEDKEFLFVFTKDCAKGYFQ